MEIRPIRTEEDHRAALAAISSLWEAAPGTPELDTLDVLATLVDQYEREHHPIEPPDPIAAIKFRMDQAGLTRRDLEPYLGGRARVAEVLSGKRALSIRMIRRLHEGLGIPAEILIQETRPVRAKRPPAAGKDAGRATRATRGSAQRPRKVRSSLTR